jgi:pyridoxal phosphate enzyme (YggS family)
MTIAASLAAVRAQIAAAEQAAGRAAGSARLVAVSKTFPVSAVVEAADAGQVDFGESYAGELAEKQAALAARPLRWHFIGRIQRNKAAKIATAWRVHAIESVAQAEALVARSPTGRIDGLMAVHLGDEATKSGVAPGEVQATAGALARVPGFGLRGLMTLPPPCPDPEDAGAYFAALAGLLADCRAAGHDMDELSMGMSHDFAVAIRHGATWVRVGTAIFGAREPRG